MRQLVTLTIAILLAALGNYQPNAQAQAPAYQLTEVASGFNRPLYVTHAGDGSGRLFVVEQGGRVWTLTNGVVSSEVFLDVSDMVSRSALEQGLLGLAFHPNFSQNGVFFINYTDQNGGSIIARYTVAQDNPDVADPGSAEQILYLAQPFRNHNGGHMAFGPDGYLYVSFGDGGSGGDPQGNGQNPATLLGAILRLDVDVESGQGYAIPEDNPFATSDAARPEIWAWGLRNVWRFSFDRETGDLFLGDVGQNAWEEINFQPAASAGGENYGWNAFEGTHTFSGAAPASETVMPILEYNHSSGRCSVTGGYVYRGDLLPDLQGTYFYGDYCSGTIWTARSDNSGNWQSEVAQESRRQISSFGEDEAGELYLVDYIGSILRFESPS